MLEQKYHEQRFKLSRKSVEQKELCGMFSQLQMEMRTEGGASLVMDRGGAGRGWSGKWGHREGNGSQIRSRLSDTHVPGWGLLTPILPHCSRNISYKPSLDSPNSFLNFQPGNHYRVTGSYKVVNSENPTSPVETFPTAVVQYDSEN